VSLCGRLIALTAALPLLLGSCTSGSAGDQGSAGTGPGVTPTSNVDVNTPELRAQKQRAGVEDCPAAPDPVAGGSLPDLTLPCLGGGRDVTLSHLRGPMVVNLFAQWCGPCRAELPYYQQLHEKAAGAVRVVGIDYLDTQPARALDLVAQTGVTYPLLADPSGALRPTFGIRGLPGVVLVDAHGKVADVEFLEIRSYDQLRSLVQQHLGVRLPR
jgi:thiol-disulfide isomerase/thioredoxin